MSWVRALVYVAFTEGNKPREESLYIPLREKQLSEDAQEACTHTGWSVSGQCTGETFAQAKSAELSTRAPADGRPTRGNCSTLITPSTVEYLE